MKKYTDNKKARRLADRRWFKDHPQEVPMICEYCCERPENDELSFHHTRYDMPRIGIWLCIECHRRIHGNIPKMKCSDCEYRLWHQYWGNLGLCSETPKEAEKYSKLEVNDEDIE